jgi:hypothetical protein
MAVHSPQTPSSLPAGSTEHGRGGVDCDRGDDAAVDSLEGCPQLVDVRTEAMITESGDSDAVRPAHGVLCWVPSLTAVRAVTASINDGAASDAMSGAWADVLEADLSGGDQTVAVVGDSYFPQLLGPALLDRTSVDRDPSVGHGAEEVGVVVDAEVMGGE